MFKRYFGVIYNENDEGEKIDGKWPRIPRFVTTVAEVIAQEEATIIPRTKFSSNYKENWSCLCGWLSAWPPR